MRGLINSIMLNLRSQHFVCLNVFVALHICGMILLVLWDGHLARPLYFGAGKMPTPQESSLDSATPFLLNF
ncbi:MAG: hypothetical protein HWQ38_23005 [Nostoc sp. NMS7]|uniref:hypothetical protein n=1 Tax=Nostoc sp. NMS7 TaxID=2815391 RepID=UPI0025F9433C|nr:hypothetical protein [Nostoc sp. NMS7]MBN3949174.1 hypothetical protein [Nostoc sp. NMS7]